MEEERDTEKESPEKEEKGDKKNRSSSLPHNALILTKCRFELYTFSTWKRRRKRRERVAGGEMVAEEIKDDKGRVGWTKTPLKFVI